MCKINIATLFSGIGTPELALKLLNIPFNIVFACEIDKFARRTYLANHNVDESVFFKDVANFSARQFKGKVDLLVAGSPCQPFSLLGDRRGFLDDRGRLFFDMIERIKECSPKIVVFENVKGLVSSHNGKALDVVLKAFEDIDYTVSWDILDAKDFGAYQRRQRFFLVAIKKGKSFDFSLLEKKRHNLPFAEILEQSVDSKYWLSEKAKAFMDSEIKGKKMLYESRYEMGVHFDTEEITAPTLLAHLSKRLPSNVLINPHLCKYGFWSCDFAGNDNMCAVCDMEEGICNFQDTGIPTPAVRHLTPRECARLQGIPDDFKFPVSDTQAYKQIGNAMNVDILKVLLKKVIELYF